jgi:hypothetical protein
MRSPSTHLRQRFLLLLRRHPSLRIHRSLHLLLSTSTTRALAMSTTTATTMATTAVRVTVATVAVVVATTVPVVVATIPMLHSGPHISTGVNCGVVGMRHGPEPLVLVSLGCDLLRRNLINHSSQPLCLHLCKHLHGTLLVLCKLFKQLHYSSHPTRATGTWTPAHLHT